MKVRLFHTILVILGLAIAIHLDWHLARHHGRLSAGWAYHWVTAIPLFGLAAWHTIRCWPGHVVMAGLSIILTAVLLGQVVEPLGESIVYRLPLDYGFGAERLRAVAAFLAAGFVAFVFAALWFRRRAAS